MTFRVRILTRAQADADAIYEWLAERSLPGANRWYLAFTEAARLLGSDPNRHARAPEATRCREDLRQKFSKTPRGRTYRLVFLIVGDEVRILRVRGPGQAPLRKRDVK
jgi:plasmid stabilization system protein ParE